MVKQFKYFLLVALFVILYASCKKKNDTPAKPDVSNFSASMLHPYLLGGRGTVQINSTSMSSGNYLVKYSCHGTNRSQNEIATMNFSNHTGTFQTKELDTGRVTYIYIDSIAIGGNSTNFIPLIDSNIVGLSDSTGLMTATISGAPYKAYSISIGASLYSPATIIDAKYYPNDGNWKSIFISFSGSINVGSYNLADSNIAICSIVTEQFTPARANQVSVYGQVNITSVSPLISGNFTFTCRDSTKAIGAFSFVRQ